MWRKAIAATIVMVLVLSVGSAIWAQDGTSTDTPTPTLTETFTSTSTPTDTPTHTPMPTETFTSTFTPTPTEDNSASFAQLSVAEISISDVQPTQMTQGVGGALAISGANFTSDTTVTLNGTIGLKVTGQNANTLMVDVGTDVAAGAYTVIVSDPNNGTVSASTLLTINAPASISAAVAAIVVAQTEPSQITAGQSGTLSIIGANFSASTTVRLVGFGFLTTSFVNSGALTAALPSTLPAGQYGIDVSDPTSGSVTASGTLTVNAAASLTTATLTPTPTPTATATSIPGQPRLVVNNFSASPSSISVGGTTTLSIEVLNVGSRTAEGVVIALGDSKFAPANGQASVTLPDLASMASYVVTLSVTAPMDASEGTQSIPLVITSRDFSGADYSNDGTVSVNILATPTTVSQVVLDSYVVEPSSAAPGDTVTVRALFKNTGSATAHQMLIQLDSTSSSILLAGPDGNSFSVGDLPAGAGTPVVMTLVVSSSADAGAQSQSFTISYLDDEGNAKTSSASISLNVEAAAATPTPLLLLQAYNVGQDGALEPGQQFPLALTIQNAGAVDVSNLLVTFGTVSTSNGTSTANSTSSTSNASSSGSSTTSVTSSTDFAIYGSGGTLLLGDLDASQSASLTQQFIVSADLTSGIHDLPITLQYLGADGTTVQQSLSASVLVVVPPRLRISTTSTLDDPLTAGTETTLALKIANTGSASANTTEMRVTGDNAEITSGADAALDPVASDDYSSQTVTFKPTAAGDYTITVEVDYVDDLNQTQTITQTFTGTVAEVATQIAPTQNNRPTAPPQAQTSTPSVGRVLLGFLGFGG